MVLHFTLSFLQNHKATFHTDAVQAFGLEKIDVEAMNIDLLSVSAHKINGPKGIGFLYVKQGVKLANLMYGGSQEKKRRAGTENVPAAVAFARAAELAEQKAEDRKMQYKNFKSILSEEFVAAGIEYHINGHEEYVLAHVLNVTVPGTDVESFLINLDMAGVLVSSGSACTAGSIDPSHVLVAMFGENSPELRSSIRFSFGLGLTDDLVREAGQRTAAIVKRLVQ